MSLLILSSPPTQQPQHPATPARRTSNVFWRDLFEPSASSPNVRTSKTGSVARGVTALGRSASFLGLTESSYLTVPSAWATRSNGGSFTLAAVVVQRSTSGIQWIVNGDDGGSFRCFHFRVNAGKFELVVFNASITAYIGAMTVDVPLGRPVLLVARFNGANNEVKVWMDGVPGATVATLSGTATGETSSVIQIGARSLSASSSFQGDVLSVERWLSALSDAEILLLGRSPAEYFARTFAPMPARLWAGTVSASYTLAADAGSYSITGSAAALTSNRALLATLGSYSISGADAALIVGRNLACGAGAYSLTGADASLVSSAADKILDAAPGAYSLSGSDAALIVDRNLAAGSGAYILTGAAASMTKSSAGSGTGATVDEIWAYEIEPGISAAVAVRRILAMLCGKVSGAGTASEVFRDVGDTRDAVTIVSDESGNRTSVTFNDAA